MHVRLDSNAAPFASCTHAGLNTLLPGVPRTVEVNVRLDAPGEVLGELRLYASTRWQPEEKMIDIPIYAIVGKASAVKRAPSARAERSVLAAKLAAEPKSMVAKSASLSPGLPHHTPPKRITSAAYTLSGFGITGSGASSTGFSSTGRSASTSMLGGSFSAAASGSFAVQGHGSMRASSAGYRTMRSSYEGEMALAASSSCQQLPSSFHSRQGDGGRMDTAQQEPMSCGSGLGSTSSGTSLCYQQYLRPAGSEAATPMQSPRSRTGSATSIQAQGQAYASAAVGASPARVLPPRPAGASSAAAARASQNGGRSGLVGSSSSTRTSLELTPGSAAAAQVAHGSAGQVTHGSVAADEGGLHALGGPATKASGSRRTSVTWLDA